MGQATTRERNYLLPVKKRSKLDGCEIMHMQSAKTRFNRKGRYVVRRAGTQIEMGKGLSAGTGGHLGAVQYVVSK